MSCSIIIPTYNRKQFEKLIIHNIKSQDYYNIVEVIVLDDGNDEPFQFKDLKIPIHYIQNMARCSIGYKRNYGCSLAIGEYIAFVDTDDYYHPNYISNGIFHLKMYDKDVSGSADMIIYNNSTYYKQRCIFIHLLNEATLVFKKSYWLENKFAECNSGEASSFLYANPHRIVETTPHMICIAHDHNTIDKKPWLREDYKIEIPFEIPNELLILSLGNV